MLCSSFACSSVSGKWTGFACSSFSVGMKKHVRQDLVFVLTGRSRLCIEQVVFTIKDSVDLYGLCIRDYNSSISFNNP